MKINSILIKNFRGIHFVEKKNLGETIIIAGQNGSGKSCIFDAIRLLKSVYGGYQQNEWQHFFGEFQIQLHGGIKHLKGLFNTVGQPLVIAVDFSLRESEKEYIKNHAHELLEESIWQIVVPEAFQYGGYRKALFAAQFREKQPQVTKEVNEKLPALLAELSKPIVPARVEVDPAGQITLINSILLNVIFSNYRPRHLGVIDFHGAQRHYGRENVQGINLNLDQQQQQYSQHTLYNYNNKYNNVKSEMAGNFIKSLLAEQAAKTSGSAVESISLVDTLKELFASFFPEKRFLGPQPTPDGSLSFPVVTANGNEHDLDDLSAGEKEILYGYLRIRSSAPKASIILLDEPELHLNPRLIRGLPEFYRKHLGEELENQIWLVTHSDTLIREAVGKRGFSIFHMLPCGAEGASQNQLKELGATEDIELMLTDLVGDLASYRPGGKGLIFEGGGDADFDKTFVSTLFPQELKGINLISGTNKVKVKALHEVLEKAYSKGDLPTKFYAIVDKDSEETISTGSAVNRFTWNVYHIENYLLNPQFIATVCNLMDTKSSFSEDKIKELLLTSARSVVNTVVMNRLRTIVNASLLACINLSFDPSLSTVGQETSQAVIRSVERITLLKDGDLSFANIIKQEEIIRAEIEQSFTNGMWDKILPGREILKGFLSLANITVKYEIFRNMILNTMKEKGHKPTGMQEIITKICTN